MKMKHAISIAAFFACWAHLEGQESPKPLPRLIPKADPAEVGTEDPGRERDRRAGQRYEEMLAKMQAAVEEIAQLYGNPDFLQVFTNDPDRAAELKRRLRSERKGEEIQRELADLEKRRDDLLNDIALRQKEASRLTARLTRQRAALDAVAAAVEQAREAVEETTK
jgi:chromosome segregation ATPase